MSTSPPERGCEDCPSSRLCDTLRSLTARELHAMTVTEIAELAIAHRLEDEEVGALLS